MGLLLVHSPMTPAQHMPAVLSSLISCLSFLVLHKKGSFFITSLNQLAQGSCASSPIIQRPSWAHLACQQNMKGCPTRQSWINSINIGPYIKSNAGRPTCRASWMVRHLMMWMPARRPLAAGA